MIASWDKTVFSGLNSHKKSGKRPKAKKAEEAVLFDKRIRTNQDPKPYSESEFNYLNRSGLSHCEKIRSLMEAWLRNYPGNNREELMSRLRSPEESQYLGAFFELYLHELMLRLGFMAEIHPVLKGKSAHPEFLVYRNSQPLFYLEATCVSGSQEEAKGKTRENIVYDALNKLRSQDYFLEMSVHGSPITSPPGAKWRRFLENKLRSLDPNKLFEIYRSRGRSGLPQWKRQHDGWDVTFRPIPISPRQRQKEGMPLIAVRFMDAKWCKEHIYIREAILNKGKKYGDLVLPFVIGINVLSFFCQDIQVEEALFGQECMVMVREADGTFETRLSRKPNGAWRGPGGARTTRVSAILVLPYLSPQNVSRQIPVLWHNPWAKRPFGQDILPVTQIQLNKGADQLETISGKTGSEILQLSPDWPLDDCQIEKKT